MVLSNIYVPIIFRFMKFYSLFISNLLTFACNVLNCVTSVHGVNKLPTFNNEITAIIYQRVAISWEKNFLSFLGFSRAINLLFYRLLQQKIIVIMTFIKVNCYSEIILLILFTQSTAVLHRYLNDEQKMFSLLQFFPDVAQNSLMIP